MIPQTKRSNAGLGLLTTFRRFEEALLSDLAEQSSEALLVVAPRTGFFRFCNHRALELTGYTHNDLDRLSLSELFNPTEADEALNRIRALERGLPQTFQDVPLKTKSGKIVLVDVRAVAVEARDKDKEELVILFARDPEQRLILERAASHQHHSLAAVASLTALLEEQLQQPPEDPTDRILTACQQYTMADFVALYKRAEGYPGYQLHKSINLPTDFPLSFAGVDPVASGEPFTWRTGARAIALLAKAARNSRLAVVHAQPVGESPSPVWMLVVGYRTLLFQTVDTAALVQTIANLVAAIHSAGAFVTTHRSFEQHALDLERRFEVLFNETTEGVLRVSSTGRVLEMNRAAEGLLGFSIRDTRNSPLEDVLISAQPLAQPIITAIQNGMRWGGVESDLLRRDGETVPIFIRAVPLRDGDGNEGGVILISDRTDLRQFQVQSDHLERRAWLGDLSAIFAHDVRNPLNGIATGLTYLADKFEKESTLQDSVVKMQAEVQRIDQLLKNVLLVAKSTEINYQPIALHQMLDRVLARWGRSLTRKKVQLVTDIDPRTPLAMADAHQMDQVLTNLIVNAVDAMEAEGGILAVKCHAATSVRTPQHGEYVQITIADTGPGIPPELQARVFDPFFTTKSTGTGLGLAITKRIITAHKGSIVLDGSPGIGTIFMLFIPVARPHANS